MSETLTPETIATLRRLHEAATPPPWRWGQGRSEVLLEDGILDADGEAVLVDCGRGAGEATAEDYAVIIAARNALPALVEAAAELNQIRRKATTDPAPLARLLAVADPDDADLWELWHARAGLLAAAERDALRGEVTALQAQAQGHAERIAAQSELLSRRAVRPAPAEEPATFCCDCPAPAVPDCDAGRCAIHCTERCDTHCERSMGLSLIGLTAERDRLRLEKTASDALVLAAIEQAAQTIGLRYRTLEAERDRLRTFLANAGRCLDCGRLTVESGADGSDDICDCPDDEDPDRLATEAQPCPRPTR